MEAINELKRVNKMFDEIYVKVKDVDDSITEEIFNENFEESSIADIRDELYKVYCRLRDIKLIAEKYKGM